MLTTTHAGVLYTARCMVQMQFANVVKMMNASLSPTCLASDRNTFPGACFFPENTLPTQKTPTFIRNSMYNYGEWEVLPQNWHNSHNFTPGGWKNPYESNTGTCVWETTRKDNSTTDGCNATQRECTARRVHDPWSLAWPHAGFGLSCLPLDLLTLLASWPLGLLAS